MPWPAAAVRQARGRDQVPPERMFDQELQQHFGSGRRHGASGRAPSDASDGRRERRRAWPNHGEAALGRLSGRHRGRQGQARKSGRKQAEVQGAASRSALMARRTSWPPAAKAGNLDALKAAVRPGRRRPARPATTAFAQRDPTTQRQRKRRSSRCLFSMAVDRFRLRPAVSRSACAVRRSRARPHSASRSRRAC